MTSMIKIIGNRNIHLTFDNGVTVSIRIGYGSYSDNHDTINCIGRKREEREERSISSTTAEVAAWLPGGEWITSRLFPGNHTVAGYLCVTDVLSFINKAACYKEDKDE